VSVHVPKELSKNQIEDFLESKRKWIYRNQAEWHDLNATRVQPEFVNGDGFLYLGRTYRLKLVDQQEAPLILKNGYFCLISGNGSASHADAAFKEFYRERENLVSIPASQRHLITLVSRKRLASSALCHRWHVVGIGYSHSVLNRGHSCRNS
jgi:hypothetical protein